MRPAFSNALYYPTIDIQNSSWLKTAILFWDTISTIVPESIENPYHEYDTQYLADIGLLRPLFVNPDDKSVIGIEDEIIELMFSSEFHQVISVPRNNDFSRMHDSKMSYYVKEKLQQAWESSIHLEKMSWAMRIRYRNEMSSIGHDGFYYLNKEFSYAYMIALANKLCEDHSLGLVTDEIPYFDIGNTIRFGTPTSIFPDNHYIHRRRNGHQCEQGLLLDFIISGISISPDAELPDIVAFRERHANELGRFRTQLSRLTHSFSKEKPMEVLQREIYDWYKNEFVPSFEDLKVALKGSKIKWLADNFIKVSMMSAGATAVPMALLGMPVEQAIFAGAGVSVISSAISYDVDKKKALRENPYSYLLSIKREL